MLVVRFNLLRRFVEILNLIWLFFSRVILDFVFLFLKGSFLGIIKLILMRFGNGLF